MTDAWDVIIIGGGPGGAATAISARRLGCRALVLEAETFPRHHVGESLVELWTVFDMLGVAEEMDTTFVHKRGSSRLWGRYPTVHSTNFGYVEGPRQYALQVERSLFDLILLRRAAAVGATVRQGHRVATVLWEGERAVGVRYRTPDGRTEEARAPVVVDASGRATLIARRQKLQEIDPFYADLAVYGYFKDFQPFNGEQAGDLFIEAVPRGWIWFIPLHTGEVSVGLVCDTSTRRLLRQQGLTSFFQDGIAESLVVRRLLADATLTRAPIGTSSYGYRSRQYAGPGWLLVGDAGAFQDPMWATGVANALLDGLVAGGMVDGLVNKRVDEANLLAFYNQQLSSKAGYIDRMVKFAYQLNRLHGEQPFWVERHGYLDGEPLPVDLLRGLSRNPFGRYFRGAIEGMGVDEAILTVMDEEARRVQQRQERARALARDPGTWIPVLPETARRGREMGVEAGRFAEGFLEVENEGEKISLNDPCLMAAVEAVDGQRTLREIIGEVMAIAPPAEGLATYIKIIMLFMDAHARGVLAARAPAADTAADAVLASPS